MCLLAWWWPSSAGPPWSWSIATTGTGRIRSTRPFRSRFVDSLTRDRALELRQLDVGLKDWRQISFYFKCLGWKATVTSQISSAMVLAWLRSADA